METFIVSAALMSFIVFGYALAVFHLKLGESREEYKRATDPLYSEYAMSVYREKAKILKPLLCTAIITGCVWISTALYHAATVSP